MSNREDLAKQAELAEKEKQYAEMTASMKKLVELDVELSKDERRLLASAYSNLVNSKRAALRISGSARQRAGNNQTREQVEQNFRDVCLEILVHTLTIIIFINPSKLKFLKISRNF